jgi:hypothetical protein
VSDEFSSYDIDCLAWVFRICEVYIEHLGDPEDAPDYVVQELRQLRDRVITLVKRKTMV